MIWDNVIAGKKFYKIRKKDLTKHYVGGEYIISDIFFCQVDRLPALSLIMKVNLPADCKNKIFRRIL